MQRTLERVPRCVWRDQCAARNTPAKASQRLCGNSSLRSQLAREKTVLGGGSEGFLLVFGGISAQIGGKTEKKDAKSRKTANPFFKSRKSRILGKIEKFGALQPRRADFTNF